MAPAAALTPVQRLARIGYATLLRLALPAYALRLWWRGGAEPLYRFALRERVGVYREAAGGVGWVWVHAVSLGETRAAAALIDALREQLPGMRLLLTHGTATGREAGAALLRSGDTQAWLPVDTPGAVSRFFDHFQPALGVLMETEVWPHLLLEAERRAIPMVLANARLSERSARRGEQLSVLLRPAAQSIALVLAQTPLDAARLQAAGARRVEVCGNLKFDVTPDAARLARGTAWRQAVGRSVVLAASTREGEEAALLVAWAQQPAPRHLLLIVPRHPQRFDEVAALVAAAGLSVSRRSTWADAPPPEAAEADVWLGDSIGEMASYFGCAQVALLGGSFEPLGGQNLIEAAACGCPVLMGPHTFNFADAAERALQEGAAQRAADITDAVRRAVAMVTPVAANSAGEPDQTTPSAERALAFVERHRGAARRMAAGITALMR
ncbi:MAG: 3-deoxy-D-manno-octulosonic acid transferase [Burkholderiales bacterium 28-67-8]|nr:MAG: 3-deoxy-D-manno-octulosonic acid transferase [Burkholderiales bacterium 28-67-8]